MNVAVEYDNTYRVISCDLSDEEIEEIREKFLSGALTEYDFESDEIFGVDDKFYNQPGFEIVDWIPEQE